MAARAVKSAEGLGHRRPTLHLAEAARVLQTGPGIREHLYRPTDDVSKVQLANPAFQLKSLYLPNTVLGVDLLISISKMKTHHWVCATLSMKNLFRIVPGAVQGWPNVLHWACIDRCIADLYRAVPQDFCVDGGEGTDGNGPSQGTQKQAGVMVAGNDMINLLPHYGNRPPKDWISQCDS